jgi:hypothetical protein
MSRSLRTLIPALAATLLLTALPAQAGPELKRRNWTTLNVRNVAAQRMFSRLYGAARLGAVPACPAGSEFLLVGVTVAPSGIGGANPAGAAALGPWRAWLSNVESEPTGIPGVDRTVRRRSVSAWGAGGATATLDIPAGMAAGSEVYLSIEGVQPGPDITAALFDFQVTGACGTRSAVPDAGEGE